jgi:sugar phosphate isomerase/epimerase
MKLSISNIAWSAEHDEHMMAFISAEGFQGLEIAPTRIFPADPYSHLDEAMKYSEDLHASWGLRISSMQSIWFGRTEKVFGTPQERQALLDYTASAIEFAARIGCPNLVFGNPKNRVQERPDLLDPDGVDFFRRIAELAFRRETVVALEPNPEMYGTNYVTTTDQAFELVRKVDHPGLRVNFDFGTVLANGESLDPLRENLHLVHHVHISEPGLAPIQPRRIHSELASILSDGCYDGFVSIEMKNCQDLAPVESAIRMVEEVFA